MSRHNTGSIMMGLGIAGALVGFSYLCMSPNQHRHLHKNVNKAIDELEDMIDEIGDEIKGLR